MTLTEYCAVHQNQKLLTEWAAPENGALSPESVSYGSNRNVWWRCEKGHLWQSPVQRRTSGRGCPYCSGKRIMLGENDLASQRPDLAAQWDTEKNGSLTPQDITPGSHRKAWWRCEKGHSWQSMVKSRVSGADCPVCAGRKALDDYNSLELLHPDIAAQWDAEKNGALTPKDVTSGSSHPVWWRCECGYSWKASIASRTGKRTGCPACTGKIVVTGKTDLQTLFSELAAQWDEEKNGEQKPEQVHPYSNRRVWWRCEKGHSYQAVISDRSMRNNGCPYCAGKKVLAGFNDLQTCYPKIAAEWHPTLNKGLTPEMVTCGSHKRIWWKCPENHVWQAVVYSRTGSRKCGCPVCAGKVTKKYKKHRRSTVQTEIRAN